MRIAGKFVLVVAGLIGLVGLTSARAAAIQAGGLTVTPATLTLTLEEGKTEHTATFSVTNQYEVPVDLTFTFERPLNESRPADHDPAEILTISSARTTLTQGQKISQTVTLRDSSAIQPGSQHADLVVNVIQADGTNVSIHPSIRMPLVIVKQSGAISSIQLAGLSAGGLRLTTPGSVTATINNDGNMIAIPRGVITVTGPGGSVLSKGVLNESSKAVTPGKELQLTTKMEGLNKAIWPGIYKVNLAYGLGGGQTSKTSSVSFFYVAWWHLSLLAAIAVAAYYFRKNIAHTLKRRLPSRDPPTRSNTTKRRLA